MPKSVLVLAIAGILTIAGSAVGDDEEVFFSHVAKFGNHHVSEPELAEGPPDNNYAILEEHGSLTLDIGHGRYCRDGEEDDFYVYVDEGEEVNYTVHIRAEPSRGNGWIQIGRGHGSMSFDMGHHHLHRANYIQIKNEEHGHHLRVDAIRAFYVAEDHH